MTLTDRIEQLKEFYRSRLSVCPFAARHVDEGIKFFGVSGKHSDDKIAGAFFEFAHDPNIASVVYVFAEDYDSHAKAREQAITLFKKVFVSCLKTKYGQQIGDQLSEIEQELNTHLAHESEINVFLAYQQQQFFSIAMNHLYGQGPDSHPRWAPVASLVINRAEDVSRVSPSTLSKIRASSVKRMGREYDADEIYILP
jgi:hypothetical protein